MFSGLKYVYVRWLVLGSFIVLGFMFGVSSLMSLYSLGSIPAVLQALFLSTTPPYECMQINPLQILNRGYPLKVLNEFSGP